MYTTAGYVAHIEWEESEGRQSQLRHTTRKTTLELHAKRVRPINRKAHRKMVRMVLPPKFPEIAGEVSGVARNQPCQNHLGILKSGERGRIRTCDPCLKSVATPLTINNLYVQLTTQQNQ
jgi:hypothetical protein